MQLRFGIIGGDMRQAVLSGLLEKDGMPVNTFGFERYGGGAGHRCRRFQEAADADAVILPLPCASDGIINMPLGAGTLRAEELMQAVPHGAIVLGGKIDAKTGFFAKEAGVELVDYFEREELAVLNAIPTAEGAVQIAMQETARTLRGAKCLVLGYGKVGRVLAYTLTGLGADVCAAARRAADLAWMRAYRCRSTDIYKMEEELRTADIVFNTVPAAVLGENELSVLKNEALVIDLASKPGGVDFDAAQRLGVHVIWALSLPGKAAPVTSAEAVRDTICNILREKGRL